MSHRIRHCVSCPHCRTRYLIGFSPYSNGAYLLTTGEGCFEEYLLYCSCRRFPSPSRSRSSEIRTCEVTDSAYRRGFGSAEEVMLTDPTVESIDLSTDSISTRRAAGPGIQA